MSGFLLNLAHSPTAFTALLQRAGSQLRRRSGHGWGLGYFQGPGCQVVLDQASGANTLLQRLHQAGLHSNVTLFALPPPGVTALEQLGPFTREYGGQFWLAIYQGSDAPPFDTSGPYRPVGQAPGELWLCALLNGLRHAAGIVPLRQRIAAWLDAARPAGPLLLVSHDQIYLWLAAATDQAEGLAAQTPIHHWQDAEGLWLGTDGWLDEQAGAPKALAAGLYRLSPSEGGSAREPFTIEAIANVIHPAKAGGQRLCGRLL